MKILGIDLGTTNSCIAVHSNGESQIIPNAEGHNTTPSVVAFTKKGEVLVGQAAKRQAITNPQNTLFSTKRLIGRTFTEVSSFAKNLPYKVVAGPNDSALIEVLENGKAKRLTPEEVAAHILRKLKADAEKFLGEPVKKAVITVPAYFNNAQREATRNAGLIAGLEVLRIINEPTAAALAYGLEKEKNHTIGIYDLGGGTFDVSILELGDNVFEVKATNGDNFLGGDNWDEAIMAWIVEEFQKEHGLSLYKDNLAVQRIKDEAEKAKISLSSTLEYEINLPFITADQNGPKHFNRTLTRSQLERLTASLLEKTIEPFKVCLKDAKLSEVDAVVLVGGMTRMPSVIQLVEQLAHKKPFQGVNPDEVVAVGAAIQGSVLSGEKTDVLLLDVTPLTLGIETAGGVLTPLIDKNSTIPIKRSQVFSTYADNQESVKICVYQGERPIAQDNKLLGEFMLMGIAPAPRGTPRIEVMFDIDANGLIKVSAKDQATQLEQSITIENSQGLSKDEIEQLQAQARKYEQADKDKVKFIQQRNEMDTELYEIGKKYPNVSEQISTLNTELANSRDLSQLNQVKERLAKLKTQLQKE